MKNTDNKTHLDKINKERYENTKINCNRVFNLIDKYTFKTDLTDTKEFQEDISRAINLLEIAREEMNWHCEHFHYDSSVCLSIDDVCLCFGRSLMKTNDKEFDFELIQCDLKEGLIILSKIYATLVLWYEDNNCF